MRESLDRSVAEARDDAERRFAEVYEDTMEKARRDEESYQQMLEIRSLRRRVAYLEQKLRERS